MAKLYIANCGLGNNVFWYRLPEAVTARVVEIAAGYQHVFDVSTIEGKAIIEQHAPYGMQDAEKVAGKFGGLCYRWDKPISVEAIKNGQGQVAADAIERALEIRKATAVAADTNVREIAQQHGTTGAVPSVSIDEVVAPGDDKKPFQEVVAVDRGDAPSSISAAVRGLGKD